MHDITGLESLNSEGTVEQLAHGSNDVYCLIEIEKCMKIPLLSNNKGLFLDVADEERAKKSSLHSFHVQFTGNNDEDQLTLGKCGAGTYPLKVIQAFKERVEQEENDSDDYKSIIYYSAHDTTIYSIFKSFWI